MGKFLFATFTGVFLNIISIVLGFINFSGNTLYDLFVLISLFLIGFVICMPSYKYEIAFFLLFQPFWAYFGRYHIFSIEIGHVLIDLQLLYVIFWFLKYACLKGLKKSNLLDKSNYLLLVLVTISFILSMVSASDLKANTVGYTYGVLLPFLIYVITRKALAKSNGEAITRVFVIINRIVIFHDLFTIFLEFSGQTFFNIESQYGRITGIFGNTLFITLVNIFAIGLCFYLIHKDNTPSVRLEGMVGMGVFLLTLLLTASRGGILIVIAYFVVSFVLMGKVNAKFRNILSATVLFVLALFIFQNQFEESFMILIDRGFNSNFTETSRLTYQIDSLKYASNDFFRFLISGVGIANFQHVYYIIDQGMTVTSAHNFVVNTIIELGIISALSYLGLIILSIFYKSKTIIGKYISLQLFGLLLYGLVVGGSIILLPTAGHDYKNILNLYTVLLSLSLGMKAGEVHLKV